MKHSYLTYMILVVRLFQGYHDVTLVLLYTYTYFYLFHIFWNIENRVFISYLLKYWEQSILISNMWSLWQVQRHISYFNGCGMPTGDAYSSGHLVPSLWDLHMFNLLRPILFPNLSLFLRTMLFEYPSVLSRFCFDTFTSVVNSELLMVDHL